MRGILVFRRIRRFARSNDMRQEGFNDARYANNSNNTRRGTTNIRVTRNVRRVDFLGFRTTRIEGTTTRLDFWDFAESMDIFFGAFLHVYHSGTAGATRTIICGKGMREGVP